MTANRILLIEHCTRGMSATFSQFLFGAGAEVRLNLVSTLQEAGRRLKEGGFGLILLSLHLPECAGVAALKETLAFCAGVPVAVLINQNEQHLRDEVSSLGAAGCYSYGQVPVQEAITLCKQTAAPEQPSAAAVLSVLHPGEEPGGLAERIADVTKLEPNAIVPVPAALEAAPAPQAAPSQEPEADPALQPAQTLDASEATLMEEIQDEEGGAVEELAVSEVEAVFEEPATAPPAMIATAVPAELQAELESLRAGRQELEGVVRTLEERCRELEAGQTALIEAEHVAIEREKAARLAAQTQVKELQGRLADSANLAEVEEQRRRLEKLIEDTRRREKELAAAPAAMQVEVETAVAQALQKAESESLARKAALLEDLARREESLKQRATEAEERLKECQWQLRDAQAAREAAQARADERSAAAALANGATQEIMELRAKLEVGAERRKHLESKLAQARAETAGALSRARDLEELIHRLHSLADKAEEADRLAEEMEQLREDLQTEITARQLTTLELNKTQAREAKLKSLETACKDLEWRLHQKEQELLQTHAQLEDLKLWADQLEREREQAQTPPARKSDSVRKTAPRATTAKKPVAESAGAEVTALQDEVKKLRQQLSQAEQEKTDFARQQLNKLEELTALYEKAQMERLELSNQLANRPGKS